MLSSRAVGLHAPGLALATALDLWSAAGEEAAEEGEKAEVAAPPAAAWLPALVALVPSLAAHMVHALQAQSSQCVAPCCSLHHVSHDSCVRSFLLFDLHETAAPHPLQPLHSVWAQWFFPSRVHQKAQVEPDSTLLLEATPIASIYIQQDARRKKRPPQSCKFEQWEPDDDCEPTAAHSTHPLLV